MTHLPNVVLVARICSLIFGLIVEALDYENEYGPDYGSEWIMFLDENGTRHTLNFSTLPTDERTLTFGEAYFYLYTRRNADIAEDMEIPEKDGSLLNSINFNSSNPIKMITHGWLSQESTDWLQKMKNAMLLNSDVNVITVDWSELAQNPIYPWSAFCTRYVGKQVAKLLAALKKSYKIEGGDVHLIGHSLGAQVMGYAGMFYETQIHRITGLDPARPLFEIPPMGKDFRLDKTDAGFVDVIHTCGGVYGYLHSSGHADFYPNDGRARQPGCEGLQEVIEGCSHGRACEFFVESINTNKGFVAYPCDSWNDYKRGKCQDNSTLMGYLASTDREGNFFLYTASEYEYALG